MFLETIKRVSQRSFGDLGLSSWALLEVFLRRGRRGPGPVALFRSRLPLETWFEVWSPCPVAGWSWRAVCSVAIRPAVHGALSCHQEKASGRVFELWRASACDRQNRRRVAFFTKVYLYMQTVRLKNRRTGINTE